jgi:hypothetical protein
MTKLKLLPAALIAAAMLTTPLVLTSPLERFPLDMGHYAYPECRK